ncbi:hypothetical protein [Gordonia sp. CPCC 205333]|uniref:hypothetical protein n=1 Tax=Gordonia sp. CPCC 205333 TaxID=3140790 RepID=UPI003AF34AFF
MDLLTLTSRSLPSSAAATIRSDSDFREFLKTRRTITASGDTWWDTAHGRAFVRPDGSVVETRDGQNYNALFTLSTPHTAIQSVEAADATRPGQLIAISTTASSPDQTPTYVISDVTLKATSPSIRNVHVPWIAETIQRLPQATVQDIAQIP